MIAFLINFDFIVCNAHMKIFVLYVRNISFIFIYYLLIQVQQKFVYQLSLVTQLTQNSCQPLYRLQK